METQDHKSPNYSGNDGHGGVHVCHKCGWSFPNHHPSSKQRRAHKRVCGTIEGHRVLDNDALDEIRVEGDVGELNSDDELKTASEKVVERTISRRSSSGVGSKSNRSTRSEDDVFTDAGTEFNESSASGSREASDGVMQRYYSMQNENGVDDTEPPENNSAGTENLCTPDLLKDNKLQTVERVEDENHKLEVGVGPQDHISNRLVSDIALESENAVDHNMIQSSEPSRELDIVPKRDEVKGVSDEVLDSVSSDGLTKATLIETNGVEDNNERFHAVGFPEKDKIESCNEVNSSGNLYSPVLQIQDIDSENNNIRKSDLTECDSKIDANENVYALPVPDSEILVGDLDHKRGKFNFSEAEDFRDVIGSDIDFTMIGDIDRVFSEDVAVCSMVDKREDGEKPVDEHDTYRDPEQMSDANSSNVDINILRSEVVKDLKSENSEEKDICTTEKKPITSVLNISPEGVAMDAGHIQETTSTGDFNVKDDEKPFTILDNDGGIVSENYFAVKNSMFDKPAIDEDSSQDLELINTPNNRGMGDVDNITFKADVLNVEETSEGVAESVTTEIRPVSGLKAGESYDSIVYSKEINKIADQGVLKISESGDIMTGNSQAESRFISQCAGKTESTDENERKEECIDGNLTGGILINDDHLDSASNKLEVGENAEHSCQSSAVANHSSNKKFTEKTLCTSEGDGTIPVIDTIVESGSQTGSLDVNWGSVSVMSTTSDAQPTADTIASNQPLALQGEEIPSMVPKPMMENQPSENQISLKTEVGIEQIESVSEIEVSKEQQHINSALQTSWTPTVADVANEPDRVKKDKEIIAKVANWDSGKQRSPLKTLLGEAIAKSRAESPIHHNQTDAVPGTNDGFSNKTENKILNSDHPEMDASQEEMGKEWDSPAKYPVKIKTEKRSKSKPYWAPFFCCSSVNAR